MNYDDGDELLAFMDSCDRVAISHQERILSKLNVAELRLLIVHYKLDDARGAREWGKAEMASELAVCMMDNV